MTDAAKRTDTSKRLSELPADQRAKLLDRLVAKKRERAAKELEGRQQVDFCWPTGLKENENAILVLDRPGDLDSLRVERVAAEPLEENEVRVRVRARALNFRDVMIALGLYPQVPGKPAELGAECAGTVVAIGKDVDDFEVGDEVVGLTHNFAEYASTKSAICGRMPKGMSYTDAASILIVTLTAYHSLRDLARVQPEERVLVHSAAGGVGLIAVQVARYFGAQVFATSGTEEKRAFLREELGLEHVFDSRSLSFAEDVLEATNGEGVDVVLNSLAGDAIQKGLEVLRPYGRFIEIGKRDIAENTQIGLRPFRKGLSFQAIELGHLMEKRPKFFRAMLDEVVGLYEDGSFKCIRNKVFGVDDFKDAIKYLSDGKHIGKAVIEMK